MWSRGGSAAACRAARPPSARSVKARSTAAGCRSRSRSFEPMAMLALLTAISLASSGLDAGVIDCTTQLDAAQLDAELPSPPPLADLIRAQVAPEILQGFDTILLTQINAIFGSENLPVANGGPVEPGIYVTVSPQQLLIFDAKVGDLQDGVVPPGPA